MLKVGNFIILKIARRRYKDKYFLCWITLEFQGQIEMGIFVQVKILQLDGSRLVQTGCAGYMTVTDKLPHTQTHTHTHTNTHTHAQTHTHTHTHTGTHEHICIPDLAPTLESSCRPERGEREREREIWWMEKSGDQFEKLYRRHIKAPVSEYISSTYIYLLYINV